MSDTVAESVSSIRLSDPRPARCSACLTSAGPGIRFVNFNDATFDGGSVVDAQTMAVIDSIDELHLCESCVKAAIEVIGHKPELHSRQFTEIRRLELQAEHWKDYALRLEATLGQRPEQTPRQRSTRRRAA